MTTRWRGSSNLDVPVPPDCTGTGTGPWPAAYPGLAGVGAVKPRAYQLQPNGCHWHEKNTGYPPLPLQPLPLMGTETGRAWAARYRENGKRWWSSCVSSTWHVGSGTRPGGKKEIIIKHQYYIYIK